MSPKLFLIGAGPGDPELITLKALKALQSADVILYDNLVNQKIFELIDDDTDRFIYVGKLKGESYKQDQINNLILENLEQGKIVARLKGGDPFVFGRGAEELELTQQAGFEVEIIPGLTSGLAVPVLNQIALTKRNEADTLVFATGHKVDSEKLKFWSELLGQGNTLILYMALANIVEITEALEKKLGKTFPITAIENGSLENQKIIEADLGSINQALIDRSIKSPVIFVLAKTLSKSTKASAKKLYKNFQIQ